MNITGRVNITSQKSSNYLIMGWWSNTTSYKMSDAGIPVVKVADGTAAGFSVYALNVESSTVGASPAGSGASQWKLVESAEFIYMQEAYIERLQAALVTAEKIESLMIRTKNIEILEGAIIRGTLEGVTGSFKRLYCIDNEGNPFGSISFGSNGRIWFENCALQHQGATGPFYASDIWVRGAFGSYTKTALIVTSGTSARLYYKGLTSGQYDTYTMSIGNISGGGTYFTIPLYGSSGNSAGAPVDLVIIPHNYANNYELQYIPGKTVVVINSNDPGQPKTIFVNGKTLELQGGMAAMLTCIDVSFQTPDYSDRIGRGWFVVSYHDNTWA